MIKEADVYIIDNEDCTFENSLLKTIIIVGKMIRFYKSQTAATKN